MKLFNPKPETLSLEGRRELARQVRQAFEEYDQAQRTMMESLRLTTEVMVEALEDDDIFRAQSAQIASGARLMVRERKDTIRTTKAAVAGMNRALGILEAIRDSVKGK